MPVPFVQQVEAGGEQRAADNHGDDHGDDDRVLESRGYLGFSFVGGRVRLLRRRCSSTVTPAETLPLDDRPTTTRPQTDTATTAPPSTTVSQYQ